MWVKSITGDPYPSFLTFTSHPLSFMKEIISLTSLLSYDHLTLGIFDTELIARYPPVPGLPGVPPNTEIVASGLGLPKLSVYIKSAFNFCVSSAFKNLFLGDVSDIFEGSDSYAVSLFVTPISFDPAFSIQYPDSMFWRISLADMEYGSSTRSPFLSYNETVAYFLLPIHSREMRL